MSRAVHACTNPHQCPAQVLTLKSSVDTVMVGKGTGVGKGDEEQVISHLVTKMGRRDGLTSNSSQVED